MLRATRLRPVVAVQAWLTAAGITEGFAFRELKTGGRMQDMALTDRSVAATVKRHAEAAGLAPRAVRRALTARRLPDQRR